MLTLPRVVQGLAVLSELRTFAADGLLAASSLMGEDAGQNVADNLSRYEDTHIWDTWLAVIVMRQQRTEPWSR